jgi:small subunit ribosomal protein S7
LRAESKAEANTELKEKRSNMPRGQYKKHPIEPDPVYNSQIIAKFINQVMRRGKKTAARKVVYGAFDIIKEKTKKDPMEVFEDAIKNASPLLEVKSKRVGGATYQVPVEVKGERKLALAFRWIIGAAKAKKGKGMAEKLAQEIQDAASNTGSAVKKKLDTHRMAEANRAFAHFAW